MFGSKGFVALAALGLTGCGGSDTPIELQPGNYAITASGAFLGVTGQAIGQGSRCIAAGTGAEHIPTMLVRPYMSMFEECGTAKFERTGNRLTGTAICPLDSSKVDGTITVTFEGEVEPDRVEGELRTKWDVRSAVDPQFVAAQKLMGAASIPLVAARTGECSASGGASSRSSEKPTFDESGPNQDYVEPPVEQDAP